jgi:hypothetical protein
MNMKRTLVLVLVALGLGLWSFYAEPEFDDDPVAERLSKLLGKFEQTDVDSIFLETMLYNISASKQAPGVWRIEEPVVWPAEGSNWESIIRNIRTTERSRSWVVGSDSLYGFGLNPPNVRIILAIRGKGRDTLDVGLPTPIDSRSYMRFPPSDTMLTASIAVRSSALKPLFELRDKSLIVEFNPLLVERLELKRRSNPFVIEKKGAQWRMQEPVERFVDKDTMAAILNEIRDFRAARFHDNPTDLAEYGLDEPTAELLIQISDDTRRGEIRILVGDGVGRGPEAGVYVMDSARRMSVLETSKKFMDLVNRSVSGYWDKHLAVFNRVDVNKVVITTPDSSFSASSDSVHQWHMEAPHEGDVKRWAINYMVAALDDARADRFVNKRPALGLTPPQLTIGLYNGMQILGEVSFGNVRRDMVYASGLGGDAVMVDKALLDKMPRIVTDLTEAPPPAAPAPQTGPMQQRRPRMGGGIPGM